MVDVRETLTGRRSLHVEAGGTTTPGVTRMADAMPAWVSRSGVGDPEATPETAVKRLEVRSRESITVYSNNPFPLLG